MKVEDNIKKIAENADLIEFLLIDSPAILYSCRIKNEEFIPTFASNNIKSVLGYSYKEFIGDPNWWSQHIHPADQSRVFKEFPAKLFKKNYFMHTYRFKRKDSTSVWIYDELKLYRDSNGNPSHIVGMWIDITKQKRAEKSLKKSENLYHTLVETIQEGMSIVDSNENIIFSNTSLGNILGYSPEELVGMNLRKLVSKENYQKILHESTKRKKGIPSVYELPMKHKNGELRTMSISATSLTNEDDEICGTVGLVTDITERKSSEKRIKKLNETLKLINKIMRHDILNQLNIVQGMLDIYAEEKNEEYLHRSFNSLKKIRDNILRMKELEYLISSKNRLKPYNIKEVFEKVIKDYSAEFEIKGACNVLADPGFYSIIDNIIRNALIHGRADKIRMIIKGTGQYCEIQIVDNGTGIPQDIREKVFDEGFSYGTSKGLGLGLYIAKKNIERYEGKIRIDANEPHGTVVTMHLKKADNSYIKSRFERGKAKQ